MKKAICLLSAISYGLCFATFSNAQRLRIGLKPGAGMARFNYEPDTPADSLDFFEYYYGPRNSAGGSFRLTYTLAGVLEYDLAKDFFLSSGMQANWKFSKYEVQTAYGRDLNKYRFNVFSLSVPLTLHYRWGKFFMGAGGYAGWALAGKWTNDVQNDKPVFQRVTGNLKFGNDQDISNLQRFDYGLRGEIGYGLKQLRLSFTFDQGLATLKAANDKPDPQGNNSPFETGTIRNQAFYFTATYYWLAK
ncbi:MAG: outer membrane beta-barrel protein [Saprospiraceae bacterium]